MTLYVSWRAEDKTSAIVDALIQSYMRLPLHGAMASSAASASDVLRLTSHVASSTALVWIVGPYTLDLVDEQGKRLLSMRDDAQHIELYTALQHKVPVIIVRYQTPVFAASDLPRDLRPLATSDQFEWVSAEESLPLIITAIEAQRRLPAAPSRTEEIHRPHKSYRSRLRRVATCASIAVVLLMSLVCVANVVVALLLDG